MLPIVTLAILLVAGLAAAAGFVLGRGSARQAGLDVVSLEALRREVGGLRRLVDRLKDLAWDHRELDSPLSTIVIDEIRTHERGQLDD